MDQEFRTPKNSSEERQNSLKEFSMEIYKQKKKNNTRCCFHHFFFFPPFDLEVGAADELADGSCFLVLPWCLGTSSAIWIINCFSVTRRNGVSGIDKTCATACKRIYTKISRIASHKTQRLELGIMP